MNSIKAKAINDFESGLITAREFGRILARLTMGKGAKSKRDSGENRSRNERRYQ